ncbi:MAG: adenylate/guanylate cyclase domain-containing protein [Candidatus Xenobia bacterium]
METVPRTEDSSGKALSYRAMALQAHEALVRALGPDAAHTFVEVFIKDPRAFRDLVGLKPATNTSPTISPMTMRGQVVPETRRWLHTGFELLVIMPSSPPFTLPLNFEVVLLGAPGERRNDIDLNVPGMANKQARLVFRDGHFSIISEDPMLPLVVNGQPTPQQTLADGDQIVLGSVQLQIFRLLSVSSELQVVSGADIGRRWKLNKSAMYIGRRGSRYNDIELQDMTVSRGHARLEFRDGTYVLVAEARHNTCRVNGEDLSGPRPLEDRDQLMLGESMLVFRIERTGPRSLRPREVTILFSDLRGYSTIAEQAPLKPLIDQLNEYLQAMAQIIQLNGGTLLSYQGDAIMAVFGAPTRHVDDADRAITSALQMQERLRQLNQRWHGEGQPEFRAGIGINTGMAMVGDIGINEHLEYAAMGDDTNVAARIEEMTRHLDAEIIISEKTLEKVRGVYRAESLGPQQIRGRSHPVTLYRIIATTVPAAPTGVDTALGRAALAIRGEQHQAEMGIKVTLSLVKMDAPYDQPVGVWRGQLTAEGARLNHQGFVECAVSETFEVSFTCRGQAQAAGQGSTPWVLEGSGTFVAREGESVLFVTLNLGGTTSTWSFPVLPERVRIHPNLV